MAALYHKMVQLSVPSTKQLSVTLPPSGISYLIGLSVAVGVSKGYLTFPVVFKEKAKREIFILKAVVSGILSSPQKQNNVKKQHKTQSSTYSAKIIT